MWLFPNFVTDGDSFSTFNSFLPFGRFKGGNTRPCYYIPMFAQKAIVNFKVKGLTGCFLPCARVSTESQVPPYWWVTEMVLELC